MLGKRAKKNRILKYLETNLFLKDYEVLEDALDNEDPSIRIQTKDRIITVYSLDDGTVEEDFRMRRGAGSKNEFLKKKDAFGEIDSFVKKNYKDAAITKTSFDESFIKVRTDDKNITITYNFDSREIVVKERARRKSVSTKEKESISDKKPDNKITAVEEISAVKEKPESSDDSYFTYHRKKKRKTFSENEKVKTLYGEDIYTVVEDRGEDVVVTKDHCSYVLSASDLIHVNETKKKRNIKITS